LLWPNLIPRLLAGGGQSMYPAPAVLATAVSAPRGDGGGCGGGSTMIKPDMGAPQAQATASAPPSSLSSADLPAAALIEPAPYPTPAIETSPVPMAMGVVPDAGGGGAVDTSTMAGFLESARLSHLRGALEDLGASLPADLKVRRDLYSC
jgi:hypothetical protein